MEITLDKTTTTTAIAPQAQAPISEVRVGRVSGGLIPTSFSEQYRLAKILVASGMLPKDIKTEAQAFTAMQLGAEIGLSPMVSCQSIAVINGRPSVWGDVALGLVQASGFLEDIKEEMIKDKDGRFLGYRCYAKRKDRPSPVEQEWTLEDAKKAKLIPNHPDSPWSKYEKRMCQMRARGFTLRDLFPDVLKGLVLPEEMEQGIIDVTPQVADRIAETTAEKLRGRLAAPAVHYEASTPFDGPEESAAPGGAAEATGNGQTNDSVNQTEAKLGVLEPETSSPAREPRKRGKQSSNPANESEVSQTPSTPQPAPPAPTPEPGVVDEAPPSAFPFLPEPKDLERSNFARQVMTRFKQLSNVLRSVGEKDFEGRAGSIMLRTMGQHGAEVWRTVPPMESAAFIQELDEAIREIIDSSAGGEA